MKRITTLFILCFILSCSREPYGGAENLPIAGTPPVSLPEPEPVSPMGELSFNVSLLSPEINDKVYVPPCDTEKVPNRLTVQMVSDTGININETVGITVSENTFDMIDNLQLAPGKYTVEALYLTSADNSILFAVPDVLDPRFPFAEMVDISVPFDITIQEDVVTQQSIETLCYTSIQFDFLGGAQWDGSTEELKPLIFFNDTPVDGIIEYTTHGIEYPIASNSFLVIPVSGYGSISVIFKRASDDHPLMAFIIRENDEDDSDLIYDFRDYDCFGENPGITHTGVDYMNLTADGYLDVNGDGIFNAYDYLTFGLECTP